MVENGKICFLHTHLDSNAVNVVKCVSQCAHGLAPRLAAIDHEWHSMHRAVATKKKLVRPKYEECEKKNDGKSCEARQAVRSTALLQLGVWGAL